MSDPVEGHAPRWTFDTRSARAGRDAAPAPGIPTSTPIVASSAFEHADAESVDRVFDGAAGYVYSRYSNPTVDALEGTIADLEGAEASLAYASGMAAIAGAFAALGLTSGAKIIAARDLYGSSITWLEKEAQRCGWDVSYVDFSDPAAAVDAVLAAQPAAVYCETLSNPLVRLVDLATLGPACADAGVPLIVDATFTPPCLLRPIEHRVALVAHSATKYLGGHGDVIAGVLSGSATHMAVARDRRKLDGTMLDPFSAWLVLRGVKTLPLRVARQCANARAVAGHLHDHAAVEMVHYPGLGWRDTPDETALLARLYPHGQHGAMAAFEIADADNAKTRRFLDALQLWGRATTLGDLGSLVLIPEMTSHRNQSPQRRLEMGIVSGLVRLSVGIEDPVDLIADLDQALAASE